MEKMTSTDPLSIEPLVSNTYAGIDLSATIVYFVILGILLMLSALISGSEAAFFSLSPTEKEQLRNDESRTSKMVMKLLEEPKEILATLLIANNFVNVGIVILSSALINQLYPIDASNEHIRFFIEIVGITLTILLIGEVIPKIYSTKNSPATARFMAYPINTLKSLPPLSWLKTFLVHGTNIIQRVARKKKFEITSDELEQALALTKEEGTSEEEHKILEGIVKFGNTDSKQIMCSRMEIVALSDEHTYPQVLELILDAGYSRVPVYKENLDNVIGILYIKDLLPYLNEDPDFEWMKILRKPMFIPENKKIDDLLKEFQEKKMHMAVVVDEYGGASGLITLEDILEEIVGDITDEFDDEEIVYTKVDQNTFKFEGRTTLVDFYKVMEIDGKDFDAMKGESETLGGFIVENAGRILKNNEYILVGDIKLIVDSSDKRRVKMIKTVLLTDRSKA